MLKRDSDQARAQLSRHHGGDLPGVPGLYGSTLVVVMFALTGVTYNQYTPGVQYSAGGTAIT